MRTLILIVWLASCLSFGLQCRYFTSKQLSKVTSRSCLLAAKMPYGKNRIRLEQVPETLFFVTDGEGKFTDSVQVNDEGIVRPILGSKVDDVNGEILWQGEHLTRFMCRNFLSYMIAKGTSVPVDIALLLDSRMSREDTVYRVAPSSACSSEEFEQRIIKFVTRKENICFVLHENSARCFENI